MHALYHCFRRPVTRLAIASVLLCGAVPIVVSAQSTITLESFQLQPAPAAPAQPPLSGNCLTGDPSSCGTGTPAARSFSLSDVENLGIVDRRPRTSPEGEQRAAQPLPSIDIEVLFDYAEHQLRPDQLPALIRVADSLRGLDMARREIVFMGHTDAVGSAEYNRDLSRRRAQSVADFVRVQAGLPQSSIKVAGMGFQYLKMPHDPENGANRRVQLILVEQ